MTDVSFSSTKSDTVKFDKNSIETSNNSVVSNNDTAKFLHTIDTFSKFPDEIDGCSCYFSPDEQSFERQEYLYVANFDSLAFISVDKNLIKLKLISTTREPETFGDTDHVDIYSNNDYKLTLDIKYKKSSGDETWTNTGTITIESKDGRKTTKTFYGECGC